MNTDKFKQCIAELTVQELYELKTGYSLHMLNDATVVIEKGTELNSLGIDIPLEVKDTESIRQFILDRAEDVVGEYYRIHPLSEAGFNEQVRDLVEAYGAEAFAAYPGQTARCTLFVDAGEVQVEQQGMPRHPYGACCELSSIAPDQDIASFVLKWIESGEAYRQYLSMNVCRYNC